MSSLRSFRVASWLVGAAALVGSFAIAQTEQGQGQEGHMQLPPGWTPEDMQACQIAGTPGKMHEWMNKWTGVWEGKTQMWMPGSTEAMESTCTSTVSMIMDGRYSKCEMKGEMPGMGPFNGLGITGYDNVSQKFVGTWIDNHCTGIMNGTGELSGDGKTLTWVYNMNCPVTKKPTTMRQVETYGDNTISLEMFSTDPKSGKEYKCMQINMTKKS